MTDEKKPEFPRPVPHADDAKGPDPNKPIETQADAEAWMKDAKAFIESKTTDEAGPEQADIDAQNAEAPPPGFMNTERVISHMLQSLKGVDLTIACEATTVVLCELTRVLNKGDHREAQLDVFRNTLAFFQRFPDTSITGISVSPHSSGPVQ